MLPAFGLTHTRHAAESGWFWYITDISAKLGTVGVVMFVHSSKAEDEEVWWDEACFLDRVTALFFLDEDGLASPTADLDDTSAVITSTRLARTSSFRHDLKIL